MSGKRYPREFKLEAIKQITERGYKIGDVAERLGVTTKSLGDWLKKYSDIDNHQHRTITSQQEELRRLKAELRRVTEERNILKEAAAFFASESKKSTHS
jgi:transposase